MFTLSACNEVPSVGVQLTVMRVFVHVSICFWVRLTLTASEGAKYVGGGDVLNYYLKSS